MADQLLHDLSEDQLAAVTSDAQTLCIVAGAGSGKTRVLTRRVAWLAEQKKIDPNHTLVLTFTRKAASELRFRLSRLGLEDSIAAGTFHSIAYAQLRARWNDRGIAAPTLTDRRFGLFMSVVDNWPPDAVRSALAEYDWARAQLLDDVAYPLAARAAGRKPAVGLDTIASTFEPFEAMKKRRRMVDFDDLLILAMRDLNRDPKYAEAIRWRYQHFFVDEFQDVNPLQMALLDTWRGGRDDLCVVGDPNQAIYAWNGADASYINDFDQKFGGTTLALRDNFRSTAQVIDAATLVLDPHAKAPTTQHSDGQPVEVIGHPSDRTEAAAIARLARDCHVPGSNWNAQAVLCRTNGQAALLQEAFASAGIPYRVRGGRAFVEHPMVKAALELLSESPGLLRDAMADLRDLPVDPTRPADHVEHRDLVVRLARDHLRVDPGAAAAGFGQLLGASAVGEVIGPDSDAVDISTFHAAKGLEWAVVHLAGLEEGYVPVHAANSRDEVAEERRLLYVAMSRARKKLTMHWAMLRTFGDHESERTRSRFLKVFDHYQGVDVPDAIADPTEVDDYRNIRQALEADPPIADMADSLRMALLEWRTRAARGANVEPTTVLSDELVDEVTAKRPTTEADLEDLQTLTPIRRNRYGAEILRIVNDSGLL